MRALLLLVVVGLCGAAFCAGEPASTIRARVEEIKRHYEFSSWPGKDGPIRDGFGITPGLAKPLVLRKVWPASVRLTRGGLVVYRDYVLTRPQGTARIKVIVVVTETCRAAQEHLVAPFVYSSVAPEGRMPLGKDVGLALGDVSIVSHPRNGAFKSVHWVRNNVRVRVDSSSEDMRPFVKPLALAIDKAILARPTVKAYRRCKNRPVVKGMEMVPGKGWQITDATDPNGERLEQYPFTWAAETFPVLINESNLVGFPPSTTDWRTPKRDQLRKFLARYEKAAWQKAGCCCK